MALEYLCILGSQMRWAHVFASHLAFQMRVGGHPSPTDSPQPKVWANYVSHSPNSVKAGKIGDYLGEYYRGY